MRPVTTKWWLLSRAILQAVMRMAIRCVQWRRGDIIQEGWESKVQCFVLFYWLLCRTVKCLRQQSFNDYVIMAGDAIRAAAVSIGYGVDRRIRGCT